jgi:hypothetical protein
MADSFVNAKLNDKGIETIPTHCHKMLPQNIAIKRQYVPYLSVPIQDGAKKQYTMQESKAPLFEDKAKQFVQQVCGEFLFLGRAVDSTLICPISAIASQSSKPTEDMMRQILQLLNYLATQEDAVPLSYHTRDMVLAVHSYASYLSEPKARSRAGGHFFLFSDTTASPYNGAVLNITHIIKNVMSLATEAELSGLYIGALSGVIRIILEELGHKQPLTPLQTDNAMADAVINGKVQPKHTKAMDMRFYWLRDCECQQQFRIYWRPGKLKYVDYWTKHHPESHHRNMRKTFLTPYIILKMLQIEQQQQQKYKSSSSSI